MRGPIVGGVVVSTFAALVFACGSSDTSTPNGYSFDAGTSSQQKTPSSSGTSSTSTGDASTPGTYTTTYAGCNVLPSTSAWNQDVTSLAVDTALTKVITDYWDGESVVANFGKTDSGRGFVINTGTAATPLPFILNDSSVASQIDKIACPANTTADSTPDTCYPIPTTAKVSRDDKNTLLFLDTTGTPSACTVYEVANAYSNRSGSLDTNGIYVDFTSVWKLSSDALKTDQYRSASMSGTSIFAGLLKREDATKGTLTHALRITTKPSFLRKSFLHPATHSDGRRVDETQSFPMGTRFRLKSSVAEGTFTGDALVIVKGLKKYGAILAGTNSSSDSFVIDGESNDGWAMDGDTGLYNQLGKLNLTDFEAVNTGTPITQTTN